MSELNEEEWPYKFDLRLLEGAVECGVDLFLVGHMSGWGGFLHHTAFKDEESAKDFLLKRKSEHSMFVWKLEMKRCPYTIYDGRVEQEPTPTEETK